MSVVATVLNRIALGLGWWFLVALILGAAILAFRWAWAHRPRGFVATPRGPVRSPTDAELRHARKFYASGAPGILPMHTDLSLVTTDGQGVPPVPRPVVEGSVVTLVAAHSGAFKVRIDVVVPRPQDRVEPENAPFQYIGIPTDPKRAFRVQFDHDMIWAVDHPSPQQDNDDAA